MGGRIFRLTLLSLAIPTSAWSQSIHPFYREDEVVFRPDLLGKWEMEGAVTLEFKDAGNKTYGIELHVDPNSSLYFRARLFCTGKRCFLDGQVSGFKLPDCAGAGAGSDETGTAPRAGQEFQPDQTDIFLNRAHGLILVSLSEDLQTLSLSKWQDEWLPKMAELDKLPVAHTKDEMGRIVLTAESEELQSWVEDLPIEAFDRPEELRRLKEGEGTQSPTNGDEEGGKDQVQLPEVRPVERRAAAGLK